MKSAETVYVVDDDRLLVSEALHEVIDKLTIIEAIDGRHLPDLLALRGADPKPAIIIKDYP